MTAIDDIIINLINDHVDPTFAMIESRYLNDNDDDFIAFAESELKNLRGLISHRTYEGYEDRINALKRYKSYIPINSINYEFLSTYKYDLVTVKKRRANGYYQDFAMIKKFYRIAVIKGMAKGNPFANFKLKKEDTLREFLNKDELLLLHKLLADEITNENGEQVKVTNAVKNTLRHFLFCCYTGIRLGDKKAFSAENIEDGRVKLRTNKTGKHIYVPLNEQAKGLLPYILARSIKQGTNRIGKDLKECFAAVGFKKRLSFHCSRHTFAINCILSGVNIITVRDWLGHRSVTTTEIYAKIAMHYSDESMNKMEEFLKPKPVSEN